MDWQCEGIGLTEDYGSPLPCAYSAFGVLLRLPLGEEIEIVGLRSPFGRACRCLLLDLVETIAAFLVVEDGEIRVSGILATSRRPRNTYMLLLLDCQMAKRASGVGADSRCIFHAPLLFWRTTLSIDHLSSLFLHRSIWRGDRSFRKMPYRVPSSACLRQWADT